MPDNLNNKGSRDSKLISLTQDWEVKYWTTALSCSVIHLKDAVAAVGHSVESVREYLKRKPLNNHL